VFTWTGRWLVCPSCGHILSSNFVIKVCHSLDLWCFQNNCELEKQQQCGLMTSVSFRLELWKEVWVPDLEFCLCWFKITWWTYCQITFQFNSKHFFCYYKTCRFHVYWCLGAARGQVWGWKMRKCPFSWHWNVIIFASCFLLQKHIALKIKTISSYRNLI
jgi:hypothetical protein